MQSIILDYSPSDLHIGFAHPTALHHTVMHYCISHVLAIYFYFNIYIYKNMYIYIERERDFTIQIMLCISISSHLQTSVSLYNYSYIYIYNMYCFCRHNFIAMLNAHPKLGRASQNIFFLILDFLFERMSATQRLPDFTAHNNPEPLGGGNESYKQKGTFGSLHERSSPLSRNNLESKSLDRLRVRPANTSNYHCSKTYLLHSWQSNKICECQ